MYYDPIAGIILAVLVILGIVASRRGRQGHLLWIVPFALAAVMCVPFTIATSKAAAIGTVWVEEILKFPSTLILVLIYIGAITFVVMLVTTIIDRVQRAKPDPVAPPDDAWPPAPYLKLPNSDVR